MEARAVPEGSKLFPRLASLALAFLVTLYALAVIIKIAREPQHFQHSFCTYYVAAQAFNQGMHPYHIEELQRVQPNIKGETYSYPPITLYFFLPFTALPYYPAYLVYLAFKAVCLVFLIAIWQKWILKRKLDGLFLLLCLIGFNFAVYWDLSAGCISLFVLLLLWAGLLAYLRDHLHVFAVLVALAASFHLSLVLFLALLVLRRGRSRWYPMLLGAGVFLGLSALSSVFYSEMTIGFLQNVRASIPGLGMGRTLYESYPPASWPLIREVLERVYARAGIVGAAESFSIVAYLALVMLVLLATWVAVRRLRPASRSNGYLTAVMLFSLAYLIVMPKLTVASYVLVLPAAYFVALKTKAVNALLVLLGVMAVSTSPCRPPVFNMLLDILPLYYPLLLTGVLWCAAVYICLRPDSLPTQETKSPGAGSAPCAGN
ncbi:MAG TPA: glycosyltransferase family 87 protein [Candidatus Hydrogenedentes bacterium]|nr:glycosyltransferase family 87 protein [Candidatus Hydrogenedentota bacterium]HQH51900.1 glycosyltransferase family 87 protein [Candidatus Hydrogenedentota bacterium]